MPGSARLTRSRSLLGQHRDILSRLSSFLVGSVAAQGLAAVTGLLLAHWLPVADYAIYTVMIVITGAMTLLTKGGTHLGYTAVLGRDWPDPQKIDAAGKIVKRIRLEVSALLLPPIVITAIVLLVQNHASWSQITCLIILLIGSWWLDMQTRVVDQVLFFAKRTTIVQALDTGLAILRIGLTSILYLTNLLSAVLATAATVAVSALRIMPIMRWIHQIVPATSAEPAPEDIAMVRRVAFRQIPIEVFTVMQTQIVLLLLSFLGTQAAIANYGAITRIAQLLVPIQALGYAFCIPAFAKVTRRIGAALAFYTSLCALPAFGLVFLSWIAPGYLLLLIGSNYSHLTTELQIATLNAALNISASSFWNLVAHRGWNRFAWLQVPVSIAWCVAAPAFLRLDTLGGVLWLQLGFSAGYVVAGAADLIHAKKTGVLSYP